MELIVKRFDELNINELYEILKARAEIFVVEQDCPYQDLDDKDKKSYHLWLEENGEILAYVRLIDCGVSCDCASIGRVISRVRRCGYATMLINKAIELCRQLNQTNQIKIHAQVYARSLYEKCGFYQSSEEFLEDGIPHIEMTLDL